MRMMSELNHLYLYSANKKVYVPIDERDKRHNSAIMLLTPSMESTKHLMQLPYIYNPGLFTSFYIDRNVSAYINKVNVEEFDEKEAEALSEAMVHAASGTKFKFDYHVSTMDEKYIRDVYNANTVKYFARQLGLNKVPDKITVVVHPTVTDLRKNPPKYIKSNGDNYFSYFDKGCIHLVSKLVYDPFTMRGNYDNYLLSELLYALIISYNDELPFITSMGIAYALSGIYDYMDKEKNNSIDGGKALEFGATIKSIIEKAGIGLIQKYIRSNDINVFAKYTMRNMVKMASKILFESELSYLDRQRLLPSDFGIPEKRKYPLHDEDHVRAAVKLFNNCDPEDEKELAKAIIKRMNRFGITDIKVSASNRFRKYYKPQKAVNEAYMSLNSSSGYNADYLASDNTHPEFKDQLDGVEFGDGFAGEIFTDKDGKLVAYYNSKKDNEGKVWITVLKCMPGYEDAYSYLISRAVDRQDAMYVSVDKDNDEEHKRYSKYGFNDYDTDHGKVLMTINESGVEGELECNWSQVQSVCSHLSPDELSRITFTDDYRNSKYVIKRFIGRIGKRQEDGTMTMEPAGFLDVYHFPSNPTIAQIVIAVDDRYRGLGVADNMVKSLLSSKLEETHEFDMYYWTAHEDNYASQHVAIKNGFEDTGNVDKYGRKVFIKMVRDIDTINREINQHRDTTNPNWATVTEDAIITEGASMFFELNSSKYSIKLKNYLYSERMKNDKEVLLQYKDVKSSVPQIRRTYLKLKMYKKFNVFVDLSYYHALFLKNNIYRMDNAVSLYFDFLNRLINSKGIDEEYTTKTIFIPIDSGIWPVQPDTDITDYRKNLNPISTIFRLVRTKPEVIRKAWGDKKIVFVGSKGYFTVDFNRLDVAQLTRFKKNLNRLMSDTNEPIIDDEEAGDTINPDPEGNLSASLPPRHVKFTDTSAAMAARIIDRIENDTSIKIDDISAIGSRQTPHRDNFIKTNHLSITSGSIYAVPNIDKENGIVIISLDPDGPSGYERLSKTVLDTLDRSIDTYCLPNK